MSARRPSTPRVRVPRATGGADDPALRPGHAPSAPDGPADADNELPDSPNDRTAADAARSGRRPDGHGRSARTGRNTHPGRLFGTPEDGHGAGRRPVISLRTLGLLVAVVIALAVLYPTIRHAVAQREELRSLVAQVEDARERTETLERQQRLWTDPEYVRAQARDRLGYVVPGERTFVVVDPETVTGTVPRDGADIVAQRARERAATSPWYLTMWESVNIAGAAPAEVADGAEGVTQPSPTPSEIAPPPGVEAPTDEGPGRG